MNKNILVLVKNQIFNALDLSLSSMSEYFFLH